MGSVRTVLCMDPTNFRNAEAVESEIHKDSGLLVSPHYGDNIDDVMIMHELQLNPSFSSLLENVENEVNQAIEMAPFTKAQAESVEMRIKLWNKLIKKIAASVQVKPCFEISLKDRELVFELSAPVYDMKADSNPSVPDQTLGDGEITANEIRGVTTANGSGCFLSSW